MLLTRRHLLQGLGAGAATTLLSPYLSDLVRQAHGQPAQKRLVMLMGNWSYPDKYLYPTRRTSETDFDLNATMSPLEPFKQDLILITNFQVVGRISNGGHGWIESDYLNGWNNGTTTGGGPSFDRFVAARIGTNDRFPSISVINDSVGGSNSFDGPNKPYPAWKSAVEAYNALFAKSVPGAASIDPKVFLARDMSVLDFVTADVARLSARLAGPEREKLDRFTDSVRAMERKLSVSAAPLSCATPPAPDPQLFNLPKPYNGSPLEAPNGAAEADVVAMAVACGLTHVAMLTFTGENGAGYGIKVLTSDGTVFEGIHGLNHLDHPGLASIQQYRIAQTAKIAGKLRDLGMGDSSLVLYTDANGSVHHTNGDGTFMVMVGKLGGALKTGRALVYQRPSDATKYPGPPRRPINDIYAALATALGAPTDKYGDPAVSRGPLEWLRG